MMRLLALPVAVPMPTLPDRAVLRLALRGLYPPAIAAQLAMDEREVDATLRRLAKLHLEVEYETASNVDRHGIGNRAVRSDGGYGHGAAVAESVVRADHEAGV